MSANLIIFRCPVNPRVISQFKYDEKAGAADAILYSMFRFPESSEVHFQCDIAVCKGESVLQLPGSSTEQSRVSRVRRMSWWKSQLGTKHISEKEVGVIFLRQLLYIGYQKPIFSSVVTFSSKCPQTYILVSQCIRNRMLNTKYLLSINIIFAGNILSS